MVFPEPDGPVTTVSFPGAKAASSRSKGVAAPKRFVSPRASTIGLCVSETLALSGGSETACSCGT